jgi:hypothetical protein
MGENPEAGLGDPYWFEWSVGQDYIVDMLDPASGIRSVTLQASGDKGLDDVIVRFNDGRTRFIQVKHTRVDDSLTFGDLVSGSPSLLSQIATVWNSEAVKTTSPCEAWIVSNRALGTVQATTQGDTKIVRPALADFLKWLAGEISGATHLSGLRVPAQWQDAWNMEWLAQLSVLGDDNCLRFLREFRVQGSEVGLNELGLRIENKLAAMFAVDAATAHRFSALLDKALRLWATSRRGTTEAITREAAFEKLCLIDDDQVGDHDLSPPAPFFDTRIPVTTDVESLLTTSLAKIVFLTGEPGSGKTSLISWLANKREASIDARFYAYRPITPANQLLPVDVGRTTTARALWSDLLLQLRALARGSLLELGLPIHAGSSSVDALRAHVLRVANILGEQRGRPFVIAIDGIDHAARSGAVSDTLLAALVPPNEVPQHVAFLVGGQPPNAYAGYPLWLRVPTPGVRRIDLPRLTNEDTQDLLRARLPNKTELELQNASRDISHVCQGHTLSTVFAVEESVLHQDLSTIAAHLSERHLASGVDEYYQRIWTHATASITAAGVPLRVASCLCLMPVRITPSLLADVLDQPTGSASSFADVLRQLRPLVIEEDGGFRVFHNDVRVYLLRLLQADPHVYRECASRLADHVLRTADPSARHAVAHDLLGIADRWADLASLFNPNYVLEGHAIGRSLTELTDQALRSVEAISKLDQDWETTHTVAAGLQTLEQLRSSLEWRSAPNDALRRGDGVVPTRPVEHRVPPRAEWTGDLVSAALADISDLRSLGERPRAKAAFHRWFAGLSPADVSESVRSKDTPDGQHGNAQAPPFLSSLGHLSAALQVELPVSSAALEDVSSADESNDSQVARSAEAAFARGLLDAAADCVDRKAFCRTIRRSSVFYLQDGQKLLARLIDARDWFRCGYFLRVLRVPNGEDWGFTLQSAVAAALVGKPKLRENWIVPLVSDRATVIRGSTSIGAALHGELQQVTAMAMNAFVFGYDAPSREPSLIREEIEEVYHKTARDKRSDALMSITLRSAAMLGSYVATTMQREPRALHIGPLVVSRTVTALITGIKEHPYGVPFGYQEVAATLVRAIVDCVQNDPPVHAAVYAALREHLISQGAVDAFLETIWRVLADGGSRHELLTFAKAWLGNDGKAWHEPPADRHDAVTRLSRLLDEIGETELAAAARSRRPWADIGYSGHKEYSLLAPLDWFRLLAERDASSWEVDGVRLLAISLEASRVGDNRVASSVEAAVLTAACIMGPTAVARMANGPDSEIGPGHRAILAGLLGMAKATLLTPDDFRAIWSFFTGQLCWQVDSDRQLLAEAQQVLSEALSGEVTHAQLSWVAEHFPAESECVINESDDDGSSTSVTKQSIDVEMDDARSAHDWKAIAAALDRIVKENPPQTAALVAQAWAALGSRPERIWLYDGAGRAYQLIYPMLAPAERWQGVLRAVNNSDHDAPTYLTSTLAANLDAFCRLAASSHSHDSVNAGLSRLLDMHELWISGGGHLPACPPVPLAPVDGAETRWGAFFGRQLLQLLAFDESEYVKATLRGLNVLIAIDPSISESVIVALRGAESHVVKRFLLAGEVIASHADSIAIRDWLRDQLNSEQLDVALSAWTALRTAHRSLGLRAPEWPQRSRVARLVAPVARPLVYRPPSRRGLTVVAARASETVLNSLAEAIDDDVDDLRSEFYDSVRDDPPRVRPVRRRSYSPGDMLPSRLGEAELDRLSRILGIHEREGRFAGTPMSRLAQALVSFADPFVFLTTPRATTRSDLWATDESLDRAANNRILLREALRDCLYADLDESKRLIGGTIRSYSRDLDVRVDVDHMIPLRRRSGSDQRPALLNARASLAFEPPKLRITRTEARDQRWLTAQVGGLLYFAHGTLDLFPSPLWSEVLEWVPSVSNPLVWVREGRRVAWFEQLHGPIRDIYPGDLIYRQPIAGRWVCVAEEWDRLAQGLGQPERRVEIDIAPNRDS